MGSRRGGYGASVAITNQQHMCHLCHCNPFTGIGPAGADQARSSVPPWWVMVLAPMQAYRTDWWEEQPHHQVLPAHPPAFCRGGG